MDKETFENCLRTLKAKKDTQITCVPLYSGKRPNKTYHERVQIHKTMPIRTSTLNFYFIQFTNGKLSMISSTVLFNSGQNLNWTEYKTITHANLQKIMKLDIYMWYFMQTTTTHVLSAIDKLVFWVSLVSVSTLPRYLVKIGDSVKYTFKTRIKNNIQKANEEIY